MANNEVCNTEGIFPTKGMKLNRKITINIFFRRSAQTKVGTFFRIYFDLSQSRLACEQALLFGRAKRVLRERASERRSREGQRKRELATISRKISFALRPDEGKYNGLKNDVPGNKVD